MDGSGNLYIADASNTRVRRVGTNGVITTVAGDGIAGFSGDGGPALLARLSAPAGVAADLAGNIYIADTGNNRARRIAPGGQITTEPGEGAAAYSADGEASRQCGIGRTVGRGGGQRRKPFRGRHG